MNFKGNNRVFFYLNNFIGAKDIVRQIFIRVSICRECVHWPFKICANGSSPIHFGVIMALIVENIKRLILVSWSQRLYRNFSEALLLRIDGDRNLVSIFHFRVQLSQNDCCYQYLQTLSSHLPMKWCCLNLVISIQTSTFICMTSLYIKIDYCRVTFTHRLWKCHHVFLKLIQI